MIETIISGFVLGLLLMLLFTWVVVMVFIGVTIIKDGFW